MPKFAVYAIYNASKLLGEYDAENKEQAIKMAEEEADVYVSLCHHCSGEIEINDDPYKFEAEDVG